MKILVFDFEVFKYDVLLGVYDVNDKKYYQTWNKDQIKQFYLDNINSVWVGHNNSHYDNHILQAIVENKNPYNVSKEIIERGVKKKLNINLYYYDIMSWHFCSLKVLEAQMGKNISESEVDFDIDRPLTEDERRLTESYNRDDLDQTFIDLKLCKSEFQLRFDIMKEFNLGLETLYMSEAQIAAKVLNSKHIEGIEDIPYNPGLPNNLIVKNQRVLNYYLKNEWKTVPSIKVNLCGVEHTIAKGGIHAAVAKSHYDWAYYLDVSGYYNLVMMNYNLFPRTIPEDGKKLYEYMYHEQLRLKKIDPIKRGVYKTILLAVFGASTNQYTDFYDPNKGKLVTIFGELFLVDLLEKLEGKVELIQSNTDGIIIKPINNTSEEQIKAITDEWQQRTHFVLKFDKIYDIHQRDVNCYMYRDETGKIHVKGNAVKYYEQWNNPFKEDSHTYSTPYIIHYAVVEYYMNGILPEETIEKYKNEPRMFQYICKTLSYDYLTYEEPNHIEKLQNVNRCFAGGNGMIYKNKGSKHDKYGNLPDTIFIHNNDISELDINKIDYAYYVKRAYEGIEEFRNNYEQLCLF